METGRSRPGGDVEAEADGFAGALGGEEVGDGGGVEEGFGEGGAVGGAEGPAGGVIRGGFEAIEGAGR